MGREQVCARKNISDSVWCIKDAGKIEDILKCPKEALDKDPEVRGDPLRFTDHLTLISCQNEQALFPEVTVTIFGPGTADTWLPQMVEALKALSGINYLRNISKLLPLIAHTLGSAVLLLCSSLRFAKELIRMVRPGLTITLPTLLQIPTTCR